jgi:hypothetical protein
LEMSKIATNGNAVILASSSPSILPDKPKRRIKLVRPGAIPPAAAVVSTEMISIGQGDGGGKDRTEVPRAKTGLVQVIKNQSAKYENEWYCEGCEKVHGKIGKTAVSSFCAKCGWIGENVPTDGDCFFVSVAKAMSNGKDVEGGGPYSVAAQRQAVSSNITEDVMETYTMLAIAK